VLPSFQEPQLLTPVVLLVPDATQSAAATPSESDASTIACVPRSMAGSMLSGVGPPSALTLRWGAPLPPASVPATPPSAFLSPATSVVVEAHQRSVA
jgi:hypothetical protein